MEQAGMVKLIKEIINFFKLIIALNPLLTFWMKQKKIVLVIWDCLRKKCIIEKSKGFCNHKIIL